MVHQLFHALAALRGQRLPVVLLQRPNHLAKSGGQHFSRQLCRLDRKGNCIVDLSTKPYQVYEQELASEKKSFSLDYLAPEQYERYARLMAPIRIDVEGGKVGLPTSISFLQGYQAQRPQMLGLEDNIPCMI